MPQQRRPPPPPHHEPPPPEHHEPPPPEHHEPPPPEHHEPPPLEHHEQPHGGAGHGGEHPPAHEGHPAAHGGAEHGQGHGQAHEGHGQAHEGGGHAEGHAAADMPGTVAGADAQAQQEVDALRGELGSLAFDTVWQEANPPTSSGAYGRALQAAGVGNNLRLGGRTLAAGFSSAVKTSEQTLTLVKNHKTPVFAQKGQK